MNAIALSSSNVSTYSRDFEGRAVTAQGVETARGEWKKELENVYGGAGGWLYRGAGWVQELMLPVMTGEVAVLAIPVLGEFAAPVLAAVEGFEGLIYAFASVVKGLVRTSAENLAIDKAGGTEADHAGVGRYLGNIAKSLVPFFDIG